MAGQKRVNSGASGSPSARASITFLFSDRGGGGGGSFSSYSIRLLNSHLAWPGLGSLVPTSAAMQIRSDEQNHISRFSPLFEGWLRQFIRDSGGETSETENLLSA